MQTGREYWDKMAKAGPDTSVVDPCDRGGHKIKYITSLRDDSILSGLEGLDAGDRVLDFGCGSGNISRTLIENGYRPTGVDVSLKLLGFATHRLNDLSASFVLYDGKRLPFLSDSFDACVTYEVFQHLTDDVLFKGVLEDIYRTLVPGGRLIAVEQTRRKNKIISKEQKVHRREKEYLASFESSGFVVRENKIIRLGHFPLIYAIRYGLVPSFFYSLIGRVETLVGKLIGTPYFDYVSRVFIVEKTS